MYDKLTEVPEVVSTTQVAKDIATISRNLQARHDSETYSSYVLFIVFRTIEANPDITINRLQHFLYQVFFIPRNITQSTIGSLVDQGMFGAVTRYQRPQDSIEKSHLHAKADSDIPEVFRAWLDVLFEEHPELRSFQPPVFAKKNSK